MKATTIKSFSRKSDNKPYWRVELEGSAIPLLMFSKPDFAEGVDIEKDSLKVSADGKYYTAFKKTDGQKREWKSPRNDNEILLSVAFKGAVELDGQWYVPDGKPHIDRVIDATKNLYTKLREILPSNPLVAEALKMGAKLDK